MLIFQYYTKLWPDRWDLKIFKVKEQTSLCDQTHLHSFIAVIPAQVWFIRVILILPHCAASNLSLAEAELEAAVTSEKGPGLGSEWPVVLSSGSVLVYKCTLHCVQNCTVVHYRVCAGLYTRMGWFVSLGTPPVVSWVVTSAKMTVLLELFYKTAPVQNQSKYFLKWEAVSR